MNTGYNFWDPSVWSFIVSVTILFVMIIFANFLIRVIKPLRKLLIPAPVLGGFILLVVLALVDKVFGVELISTKTMELITFHGLGLGCAAMSLKTSHRSKNKHAQRDIFRSSLLTASGYLIQAVTGLIISLLLYFTIRSCFFAGMLLPMGYGQGPGQAYTWGHTYETSWGFADGTSFGLTVSAMGFVSCSVGGVIYLNHMRKKGDPKVANKIGDANVIENLKLEDLVGENDIPMSDSMDKMSVQLGVAFFAYTVAYLVVLGLSTLCDASGVGLLTGTVKPLLWGFNFIFATLSGTVIKSIINLLKKKQVIKKDYLNNHMLDRISGFTFDLMIVASIGAINLMAFANPKFVLPLLLMCVTGAVVTFLYVDHVCKRLFPTYKDESFLAFFGMLTGVIGPGIILLRQIDPSFESPAAHNLIYQTLWTALLGFPLLLFMGFAPKSLTWGFITLGIDVVMFIVFYLIIRILTRYPKTEKEMNN